MKGRLFAIAAAGAVLFLSASCAEEPPATDVRTDMGKAMITLSRTDKNAVLTLAPGESFEVRLPENPTTGYVWEVEPIPGAVATSEREAFEQEPADPRIVGRGGTRILIFRAGASGEGEIVLRLRRPWQRDAFIDSFAFKVKIAAKRSAGGDVP